ncbi:molybdenum cofactor guanylyltransferase [Coleofasciculus sp. FACHB-T130]|uniref:molybdenum cofactor guanylyltransferase n=1 Tax=Cyanophyceae TaxID=3028117 RepID=UPI0016885121|nr:molybdenum cofactor guanylyltransferase [Coleofasciculus sp. FACHB-T130]MBD1880093.1 molybdenum cofactor guanylyltransferase [Coleofasciculus sp. FACHB-T130]
MNPSSAVSLTAIVLAGGKSSRMGRDKALISVKGVPLIRRVCEVAQACASKVYVVTLWIERYQDIVPSTCKLIREVGTGEPHSFSNDEKPQGPLIGFAQGLAPVQTEWVLLLACDLPNLKEEVLQNWVQHLPEVPEDCIAFLPRHPKGWEPLCGFYRRRCLPSLTEFINKGGRSFQQWLSQHPVQELPLTERSLLFNCNTPADLEQVIGNKRFEL